jgi:RNA polymerase sigma factor (sigma-70 family)
MSLTASPVQETAAPARRPHAGALSTTTLRHASDDRLVTLTRGGSERAFAEIMRRYQRPLQFYCLHMVGAPRAEDAVQQAFMQAFVALRDGERREIALRPWLYRIARNCAIDLLRKQPYDHDELDPDFDGMLQPPVVLEQKEELARIVAAIQALPERQRRALTLRELEGRSYGEISAELGHTDSGVRQLIFRARTALRNLGALILPFESIRWRLVGSPSSSAADPHHLAAAATVSSGGGPNVLQAAASVVVGTLALIGAGPSSGAHHGEHGAGPAGVKATAPFGRLSSASGRAPGAADRRANQAGHNSDAARAGDGGAAAAFAVPLPVPLPVSVSETPAQSETASATVAGDPPTERAAPEASGGEQPEKLEALDSPSGASSSTGPSAGSGGGPSDQTPGPAGDPAPAPQSAPGPPPASKPAPSKPGGPPKADGPPKVPGPPKVNPPKAPAPPKVNPPKLVTPNKPVPPRAPAAPKPAILTLAS